MLEHSTCRDTDARFGPPAAASSSRRFCPQPVCTDGTRDSGTRPQNTGKAPPDGGRRHAHQRHPKPVDIVLDSTGRKFNGPREWGRAKHGERRRAWRKLHVSFDPATSEIVALICTDADTSDAPMAGPLVAGSGGNIRRVFGDGAYDGAPVTDAIRGVRPAKPPPKIVVPPPVRSIPSWTPHGGTERARQAAEIATPWQARHPIRCYAGPIQDAKNRSMIVRGIRNLEPHRTGIRKLARPVNRLFPTRHP